MELKDRKYIKNTGNLPGFENGEVGDFAANKSLNYPTAAPYTYGNIGLIPFLTPDEISRANGVSYFGSKKPNFNISNNSTTSKWANFDAGSVVGGVTNLAGSIYNAHQFNTTSDDIVNSSDNKTNSIGGVGYSTKEDVDRSGILLNVKKQNTKNTLTTTGVGAATGAAIGSIIPGVGTLIGGGVGALVGGLGGLVGGLLGGSKRKHDAKIAIDEALQSIDRMNAMSRSDAYSTFLQRQQALKFGDNNAQTLIAYKCGKSPKYANGKQVYSAFGPVNAQPDARVSKGEVAIDTATGSMYRIPTGPNDTALFAGGKDPNIAIITNKYGLSDYAMVDPEGAIEMLKVLKDTGKLSKAPKYKCGKLPKCANGITPLGNVFSSLATGLTGLQQYMRSSNDKPYRPSTYVLNPYMRSGLNMLAGLNINPYSIIQQMRGAEARNNYAINASGGLSTAQKNLARISSLSGTQQNIANALSTIQQQNNAYKSAYANAALQYGGADATSRMQANQYDLDYFSKANAARSQGMQIGAYNMINALQQYYANDFKRRTHNQNMARYEAQDKLDRDKFNAALRGYKV